METFEPVQIYIYQINTDLTWLHSDGDPRFQEGQQVK